MVQVVLVNYPSGTSDGATNGKGGDMIIINTDFGGDLVAITYTGGDISGNIGGTTSSGSSGSFTVGTGTATN